MAVTKKRYSDKELDRFEDQISSLETTKSLFLVFGILSIVLGTLSIFSGDIANILFNENLLPNDLLTSVIITLVRSSLPLIGIPGGIALLVLRKALIMRKIRNLNKLIDDELDERDREAK